jgi:next-to-BRCA1 protein 1
MESLMASSQSSEEGAFMMDPEAVEGAQIPAMITPKSTENDVDGDATVQKVGAENVHVPELETTGNKLELEQEVEVAPGTLRYPEISLESLVVDSEMTDAGNAKVEGTSVEDGEFFMVNSATITEIPVQEPDSEMTANPGVVTLDDEAADSGKEEMVMTAGAESEANAVDALLETLDSMGFKQRDFNQMLLKKNEYDLQRTLDNLVMAAERESLLEELEEMGFYDTNLNRQLMLKHNGSVKRVVKELVQMYKDPKGKQQV